MAAGFVQVALTSFGAGARNSATASYPNLQNDGDLNVLCINYTSGSVQSASVIDAAGNTYSSVIATQWAANAAVSQIFFAPAITPSFQNKVTINFGATVTFLTMALIEYSGLLTTVDVSIGGTATSVGPASSGAVSTTNANDLLLGWVISNGGLLTTAGSTQRFNNATFGVEDAIVSSAGSNSATWTLSASDTWVAQMVAFKINQGQSISVPVPMVTTSFGVGRIGLA